MTTATTQAVSSIFTQLISVANGQPMSSATIIALATQAMVLVEAFIPPLTGAAKQQVVLTVIQQIIDAIPMDPTLQASLTSMVSLVLPEVINQIIAVNNGTITITPAEIETAATSCCSATAAAPTTAPTTSPTTSATRRRM